ncbi:Uncharacterised protein [Paenibacillus polymyxa]|uniref:BC1872 family protein n=1 Tax=Paenibacillus polymyxa TaxID=1406 RepID=UPI000D99E90F|nr:hypothetical protein [Paenibacillus polymyxa]SPY16130.1 Uncharacterised protein [Paenibacillus polymyxa]
MSLTRDLILSTKAGTALDRLVEEHILEWVAWQELRGEYLVVTFQKPGAPEPYKRSQKWESEMQRYSVIQFEDLDTMKHAVYGDKDFSTDISLAWEVEEKIKKMGLHVEYCRALKQVVVNTGEYVGLFDYIHATPEQRCKAALLAVLNL